MYTILDNVSSDDAIHIIYYIIKILNKTKNGSDTLIDFVKIETELNDEQRQIADAMLDEIDKMEDKIEIDKITTELFNILKSKTNSVRKIDTSRGKALLKKMKED